MRISYFKIFIFSSLFICTLLKAQTKHPAKAIVKPVNHTPSWTDLDKKILNLPTEPNDSLRIISDFIWQQTTVDSLKARLAFLWVANNIEYDITKTAQIDLSNENIAQKTLLSFYNRKGICGDYAHIFSQLLSQLSIKNYVIEGEATPDKNMKHINPHAWVVAKVNQNWYLYDPTWAAGGINTTGKFIRNVNLTFYKNTGNEFIKSHMPFDYMWQLLDQPYKTLSLENLQNNRDLPGEIFNYTDSIAQYESLSSLEQSKASLRRLSEKLYPDPLFRGATLYYANNLTYIQNQKIIEKQNEDKLVFEDYNKAVDEINEAVADFNIYIEYKNKQFYPSKTDAELSSMLSGGTDKLSDAQHIINTIEKNNPDVITNMNGNKKMLQNLIEKYQIENAWLEKYLKKGKIGRAFMFSGFGKK